MWSGPPLEVLDGEPWLGVEPRRKGVDRRGGLGRDSSAFSRGGVTIKAIMRPVGLARNTVRDALRSDEPPRYEHTRTGSAVDAVEPQIRELLAEFLRALKALSLARAGRTPRRTSLH